MQPKEFVAEVYRRMGRVNKSVMQRHAPLAAEDFFKDDLSLWEYLNKNYHQRLPKYSDIAILDVGCGSGHFLAACARWGYRNLSGMDYSDGHVSQLREWGVNFYQVLNGIPSMLFNMQNSFDVIHAAHLVEHIPKHDLFENIDAIFYALKPGGILILETPNMLSPAAMASLFVSLGHEYGFSQHNLESLLSICGFEHITVNAVISPNSRLKWQVGNILRQSIYKVNAIRNRLFGWTGLILSASIIAQGSRPLNDPLPERQANIHSSIAPKEPEL